MSFSLPCRGCDTMMEFPDHLRGKTIRCKHCGHVFTLSARRDHDRQEDFSELPRQSRRAAAQKDFPIDAFRKHSRDRDAFAENEDFVEELRSPKGRAWLLATLVTAILLVGSIAIYWWSDRENQAADPAPVVAQAAPLAKPPRVVFPQQPDHDGPPTLQPPRLFPPIPQPALKRRQPPRAPAIQPPKPRPLAPAQGNTRPPAPEVDSPTFAVISWKAQPDPQEQPLEFPAKEEYQLIAPIPAGSGRDVLYPSTSSAFMAVGRNQSPRDVRLLWDLTKNQKVGVLPGKLELRDPIALSPNGHYLAGTGSPFDGPKVDIYQFVDNASTNPAVRRLELGERDRVEWLDFGSNGETVLLYVRQGLEHELQIWNIDTGANLHNLPLPDGLNQEALALSPNRTYLAAADRQAVFLCDLGKGELVGSSPFPPLATDRHMDYQIEALAFAPDGSELAGLFRDAFHKHLQVVAWDLASGKMVTQHDLSDAWAIRGDRHRYRGSKLEYMPGLPTWLVHGDLVIDRASGVLLTRLPFAEDDHAPLPRRLLPNQTGLIISRSGTRWGVTSMPINGQAIEQALAAVAKGPEALPKLTTPDRSSIRRVRVELPGNWQVTPEPLPVADTLRPLLPLAARLNEVRHVALSGGGQQHAAVLSLTEETEPLLRKVLRVDRHDLVAGGHLGSFTLPVPVKGIDEKWQPVADLSLSGKRYAIRTPSNAERIDVFDAETGAHLCGYRPYQSAASKVRWLGFTDDDRLLTLSEAGQLALWEVPACKAVYECQATYTGGLALSLDRAWLAAEVPGQGLVLLDTAVGEPLGRLPLSGQGKQPTALAFHPNNRELAAVLHDADAATVACWDLESGEARLRFSAQGLRDSDSLHYCSQDYLCHGGTALIDLRNQIHLWTYIHPHGSTHLNHSPDGRHWYVFGDTFKNTPANLGGLDLPEAKAGQLSMGLGTNQVQRLLAPGMPIQLTVNAGGADRQMLTADLTRSLKQAGFLVGQSRLVLHVDGSQSDSGDQMRLDRFGGIGRGMESKTVNIPQVVATMQLTLDGQELWSTKDKLRFAGFMRHFGGNEDPRQALLKDAWANFASWARVSVRSMPQLIVRVNGEVVRVPGRSLLPGR